MAELLERWLEAAAQDPSAAGPPPSTQDVLAQLAGDDPRVANLVRYMSLLEAQAAEDDEAEDEPEPPPPAYDTTEIRIAVRKLHAEVEQLRQRNDLLAAALGGCYLCWGEDPACENCAGRGRPGSSLPDARAFRACVLPAVRRVSATRRAAVPPTPPTEGAPQ